MSKEAMKPAQQEPVSWCSQCGHKCPPAQRKPLTDKQRSKMYRAAVLGGNSIMLRSDYELGIIDAEAAHGIKEKP